MIKMSESGIKDLKDFEGYVGKIYKCPAGSNTLGYGHNIDANPLTPYQQECWDKEPKRTASMLLINDLWKFEQALHEKKPFIAEWSQPRIDAVIDMTFNMGEGWLNTWPNTWDLLHRGQFGHAARSILKSKYARQVKGRARINARKIETGENS